MKITVDFDITAEEVRKLFGLPDVEAFQRQLMDDIRERMMSGVEGYDPIKLFQPYMTGTMASWDMFQKLFANVANLSATGTSSREMTDTRQDAASPARKK